MSSDDPASPSTAPDTSPVSHPGHPHPGHDDRGGHLEHTATTLEGTRTASAGHRVTAGHPVHSGHSGHPGHDGPGRHEAAGHPEHGHSGHGRSGHGPSGHGDHVAVFRRRFWIMLAAAVPVVAFSGMFADIVGYTLPDLVWIPWISPVLGTVMYVWGGSPFLTGAVSEITSRKPGMMLLVALAITVAFLASWGSTLGVADHELDFWWELALLIVVMLLGHWIEMRSLAQTSSALESLAALLPDEAERVEGDEVVIVSPSLLRVGDLVIVRPGGRVPADGQVVEGTADVDESMITGESRPVTRSPGSTVVAGTVATDTALRVRVTAVGEETALAGIQRLVTQAQNSSSHAQRLADTAAGWLFWFALGVGALTAVVWVVLGDRDDAVIRSVTVLAIACPHALGLAIPLVVSISTERAAKGGVLIKDRLALESMRKVNAVLFDKTGTLTKGSPALTDVLSSGAHNPDEVLALAAAVEADSEHPLASAVVAGARSRGLDLPRATDFRAAAAVGVEARVGDRRVGVGGPAMLRSVGAEPHDGTASWAEDGAIVLHVVADGEVIGALRLEDEVRDESRRAVDALGRRGVQVVMITGDAASVAHTVAAEIGIDRVFAGVRPEDKAAKVIELQREGLTVAMVGDGINDAPALAQADIGIAIGAGTDVAIGSAGVILAGDDPRSVLAVIDLSRASYRKMKQNLWWAAGYNLISVPLAAGILAPVGFVLPMAVGALLMSASTIVVALNAQLLRRLDLSPAAVAAPVGESDAGPGAIIVAPAPPGGASGL